MNSTKPLLILLLFALCCLGGCESSQDAEFMESANDTNLKKISNAYHLYAARFGYTGPESMEVFKDFLKTNDSIEKNLELMEIDRANVDQYFISDRDGAEFKFRWGVFINPDTERSREPIVFESEGKDGTRLVMLSNRKTLEVSDDKKYEELLKGKVNAEEAKTEEEIEAEQEAL